MSSLQQYGVFDSADDSFRWEYWDPRELLVPIVPLRDPHPIQNVATKALKALRYELLELSLSDAEVGQWNWVITRLNSLIPEMLPGKRFRVSWLTPGSDFEGEKPELEKLCGTAKLLKTALERTGLFDFKVTRGFPLPFGYGMQIEAKSPFSPENFFSIYDWKHGKRRWAYKDTKDPIRPFVPSLFPRKRERVAITKMNHWIEKHRGVLEQEGALGETNQAIKLISEKVLPKLERCSSFRVMALKKHRDFDPSEPEALKGLGKRVDQLLNATGIFSLEDQWEPSMCWVNRRALWLSLVPERSNA